MADPVLAPPRPPLRVLHLIDGLGGGGSERLLWDAVRLADPSRVQHRVATASPDWFGDFKYAEPLAGIGAYARNDTQIRRRRFKVPRVFAVLRDFMRTPHPGNPVYACLSLALQLIALFATLPGAILAVLRHRPDVVHTHTFYSFVHGIVIGLVSRMTVVHTVPCQFDQMRNAGFPWLPWCYRWSSLGVRTWFTGASVADLLATGITKNRIVPLSGGLDLVPVHAARADSTARRAVARRRLGLPVNAIVALNIGRLHESKGQSHAVAAVAKLSADFPQLHLVILGEGHLREALTAQATSLSLGDRVHLPGFWADPLDGCAAADIYLRTGQFEGDNLSSLQALGLGLPAVGFDTRREVDVIRSAGAGLLVPIGDVDALALAAATILASPDRGAALGRAGAAYIDANLGIASLLHAYDAAYYLAIERRPVATTSRTKTVLLWLGKFAVSALILTLVFTRIVDWPTLARAAASFPLSALGIVLGLHLLQRGVVAWQTRLALHHAGVVLTTPRVFHIHLITSFFSVVLPGELAGAAVSWHLFSRDSGRRSQTAAALIYLRLIALFMLVLVGAVGLLVEPRLTAMHAHWAVLAAGIIVGLPLLSFHAPKIARRLESVSNMFTGWLPWDRLRSAFISFWSSVHEFTSMPRMTQFAIWLGAALVYGINVSAGLVAMHAAHIHAPDIAIVWLLAIVSLVSLVPFTLGGFGVRELGVAVLLKQWYGVPTESAVLLSLALGTVGLIASVGFGGVALLGETVFGAGRKPANIFNPSPVK
ncbi:MAG: flippase-like domain-containing protein [Undibacterium sp.]|nr:flippase-like domain-containing protein [Opitutaceae bacterium]